LDPSGNVYVGVDDFARKLIGEIDAVEMPESGTVVEKGQHLFSIVQGNRTVPFKSPVSGKVMTPNETVAKNVHRLQDTCYNDNWICMIVGGTLESDLKDLKIGHGAVEFYTDEIKKVEDFVKGELGTTGDESGVPADGHLYLGVLGKLKDEQFKKIVQDVFSAG
jgi:glycine cleavage system H protein